MDVQAAILDVLRRTPRRAEFVSRLLASLRRSDISLDRVEQALTELQAQPAILVHEHYCADPHLASADLRVAAMLEAPQPTEHDPIAEAAERIETVWQRWLSDYLSNHTCV